MNALPNLRCWHSIMNNRRENAGKGFTLTWSLHRAFVILSMSTFGSKRSNVLTTRAIPILAYHSFETSSWKYALDPVLFEEHLAYLSSQGYISITLSEYAQSEGLALSAKPIILSFNGAFKSVEQILPILQKHTFRATFFVPTAFVGKETQHLASYQGQSALLDWQDLESMGKMGMEIASHGHEYLQLDVVPEVLARQDISRSKVLLEDKLGQPCMTFAYPQGYHNTQVRELVRVAGFSTACSMEERVSTLGSDMYALPRLVMTSGVNARNLKYLIRQKDSGFFAPYTVVKSSVFRQFRKWNVPLRDLQENADDPVQDSTPHNIEEKWTEASELRTNDTFVDTYLSANLSDGQPEIALNVEEKQIYANELPSLASLEPASYDSVGWNYEAIDQVLENDVLLPTPEQYQLELQGEYLASCKAVLSNYPFQDMPEYQHLLKVVTLLQDAQENTVLFHDFEQIQEAYAGFEEAITDDVKTKMMKQQAQIQRYLDELQGLPVRPLQTSAERLKHILENHQQRLEQNLLGDTDLKSLEGLMLNFRQRLRMRYGQNLMGLLHKATKLKALDVLKEIQHAGRILEQEQYPNLEELEQLLSHKIASDKSLKINARRVHKFNRDLEDAKRTFERISQLNNENAQNAANMLSHLTEQQVYFPQISAVLQDKLILLLKEVKISLNRLMKEFETTALIALQILTSDTLDQAFDIFEEKEQLSPKSQSYYSETRDPEIPTDLKN
jgi:peptidoglycan/xylan/chitin deacetylase (PgdA/CDA1 family)